MMKGLIVFADRALQAISTNQWLIFAMRLVLGSIFLVSATSKLSNQADFIGVVTSYNILPDSLAEFYGLILPWTELIIGSLLILGLFSRLAAGISIPLVISFLVANVYTMSGGAEGCGEGYCGCFGEALPMSNTESLALDIVMLLLATPLLVLPSQRLSASRWIFMGGGHSEQRRFLDSRAVRMPMFFVAMAAALLMFCVVVGPSVNGIDWRTSQAATLDSALHLEINGQLETEKPVLVFFYKESCEFCEDMKPMLDELEPEYVDQIKFIRVNGSKNPEVIQNFGLKGFPTTLVISGMDAEGAYEKETFLGFTEKETLKSSLDYLLANEELDDESQEEDQTDNTGQSEETEGRYCSAEDGSCSSPDDVSDDPTDPDEDGSSESTIDAEIDEALTNGKPVFMFFHADECDLCQDQELVVADLEQEYTDEVAFIHVDADDNLEAVQEFSVSVYPTIFLISGKDGEGQYTHELFEGFTEKATLQSSIESLLESLVPESPLDGEIDEALGNGKLVFLFFHADWCHYCQDQKPIVEELEQEYAEEVVFLHIDVDDNPEAVQEFGVSGYPAIFLISGKDAECQYQHEEFTGFTEKATLQSSIDALLLQ